MPETMDHLLYLACFVTVSIVSVTSANKIPADPLVIETTYGPLRGEQVEYAGTQYKAFRGIPYAAPPVGDLRFAAPKPPLKWTEVKDATRFGYVCTQKKGTWTPPMHEDCLTLNVYTPTNGEHGSKPVLVWIHGGAFIMGDGTDGMYGPQHLIAEDIVIVTINYRLGALGFLTANTAEISGNWGLKDQVAALKWVQENIARFGGDPKQVTVYGESAGAISVHLHLFSPLSEGLFSKAIVSSGAGTIGASLRLPGDDVKYSQKLARLLGASESDVESPNKMMEFLRKAEPDKIIESTYEMAETTESEDRLAKLLPFVPVIEAPESKDAFLTKEPRQLLAEGKFTKVPMIIGLNDLEGAVLLEGLGHEITQKTMNEAEENVCAIVPRGFDVLREAIKQRNECPKVAQEIRNTYFDGKPFNSSLLNFIYLCGDLVFTLEGHFAQRAHARASTGDKRVYSYYFTFDGKWNMMKKLFQIDLPGAAHAEDLAYVFKSPLVWSFSNTSPEAVTRNRMVRMLGNFVKTGDPTPAVSDLIPVKWEPASKEQPNTLVIGEELKLEKEFLKTRMGLWDKLFEEYTGKRFFS